MKSNNTIQDEALKHALSEAVLHMIHKAKISSKVADPEAINSVIQASQESGSDAHV